MLTIRRVVGGNVSLVAAALLGMILIACGPEEEATSTPVRLVKAIKVGDASDLDTRALPGRARAAQEVDLAFRVAGPLITRPVNVGDEVKAGEVVARIDPRDYEVERRNALAQLQEAKAALARAQGDYDRIQRIFKHDPGATSEAAVDKAREERDRAQATVKSLEATVAAADDRLSDTYLKAPFDGTVVTTYVENFQTVRANQPIVRLLDTQRIKFDVDVPERYIAYVPTVKNIRVRFDAFPDKEIPAELFEIGTEASQTTRTYPVTLIMDQPDGIRILAGMAGKASADVNMPEGEATAELVVPVSAVLASEEPDKSYLWVIDESTKTVSLRPVVARRLTDRGIIVEQGLEPGEWIATAGVHFLEEGQRVEILTEASSAP